MTRALLAAVAVALLAACGGGEGELQEPPPAAAPATTAEREPTSAPATADPEAVHVHGLGLGDGGALLIATHRGLYRLEPGDAGPLPVGETRHDLMGFTVAAPGRFLASGHPDVRGMREDGLPPHLGLIESRDGGETWQSVSLLGEADFHVLRAAGERVYGFDATHGRLLASEDGGGSWDERESSGHLFDVALDPADPDHVVAAAQEGLRRSRDGGRSWEESGEAVGLLAWPADGPLYLVDPAGAILVSEDAGAWRRAGEAGGQPAAFLAAGPRALYAALHDGTVTHSQDGGETWRVVLAPPR